MIVIFIASTDLMSAEHTSRFLAPLLRWIVPDISPQTIATIHFFLRKCAHFTEYAILAALLWRALSRSWNNLRPTTAIAFVIAASYAGFDEFHQTFVPSRTASPRDVMIDCCGALIGLLIISRFGRSDLKAAN
jgi:VanZ family protein